MVDWVRVQQLRDEIGEENFEEVVAMFLDETDAAVARLAAGPAPQEVEAILHCLKGSSINLGLATMAQVCATGEKTAAAGRAEDVDLAHIVATYGVVRQMFVSGLAERRAA